MEKGQPGMDMWERTRFMGSHMYAERRTVITSVKALWGGSGLTSEDGHEFRPITMFWEVECHFHGLDFSLRQNAKDLQKSSTHPARLLLPVPPCSYYAQHGFPQNFST